MRRETLFGTVLFVTLLCSSVYAQSSPTNLGDERALEAATQGLCHKQIAMLGESATHGDGHTVAFKVTLVERLIDQCGFDSVFFEASHYEFIDLNRRLRMGQTIAATDISSAVGGLWKSDQEFQPLPRFLLAKAQRGQVFLGGIDDQLGQMGQDFANIKMVAELTSLLPQRKRQMCSVALHNRIYSEYPDGSPYSRADQAQIETCLSEMRQANAADTASSRGAITDRQEMISNAQRWISRDFTSDAEYIVNRDRSMFQDFEWLRQQQPKRDRVIIWAATVHAARRGDPSWGDHTGTNFGSFVHQKYGNRAFTLGFSALAGLYRQPGNGVREMRAAPPDSVEEQAMGAKSSDAIFVGSSQLAAMKTVPGAFFRHSYQTLPWFTFLDGVVVFRDEHPPTRASGK